MAAEEHLLAQFFVRTKRERYVEMISTPKKRERFRRELDHFHSLNPRYMVPIAPSQQHPEQIALLLTQRGAPQLCWITSSNRELDGKQMTLLDALEAVVGGQMGTFLTCIPGRLAYFEGEDTGYRWILER